MRSGAAAASDQAASHTVTPSCVSISIPATNLVAGDNVLAAEVHQFDSADSDTDVYLGIQMDLVYQVTSALPPKLISTRNGSTNIVSWKSPPAGVWGLEYTTNLLKTNTVWTALPNASPYTNTMSGRKLFRVHIK